MYFLGGSSPRMRGTHVSPFREFAFRGIIPAYAGNTPVPCFVDLRFRDHPRVCGEHAVHVPKTVFRLGSSPRMRGTLNMLCELWRDGGIIPAYAGNTWCVDSQFSWRPDHPRVCGEHMPTGWNDDSALGSSPRMRGTRFIPLGFRSGRGIIPAYAGNTARNAYPFGTTRDHPRVCGEHNVMTTVTLPY